MTAITGTYNGLTFGLGGSVALAEATGLDDLPELRTGDQDKPGEGMVPGSDYAARRRPTMTWLLMADPAALPALRTSVQRACRVQRDTELPLTIINSSRELRCRPRKLVIERQLDADHAYAEAAVEFVASDPWWYDASDTAADFTVGQPATFFPFFPLRLSSSEVFADASIDNDGDVDTWPVWTITGPGGAGLVLRNLTTGKLLSLNRALSSGEIVTIDTRPGAKSVTLQDGTNLFPLLSGTLWPLAVDSNSIRVELSGATTATLVSLRYRRRFVGAGV